MKSQPTLVAAPGINGYFRFMHASHAVDIDNSVEQEKSGTKNTRVYRLNRHMEVTKNRCQNEEGYDIMMLVE